MAGLFDDIPADASGAGGAPQPPPVVVGPARHVVFTGHAYHDAGGNAYRQGTEAGQFFDPTGQEYRVVPAGGGAPAIAPTRSAAPPAAASAPDLFGDIPVAPSPLVDSARVIPTSLEQGVTGQAGMMGNIADMGRNVGQDVLQRLGFTPDQAQKVSHAVVGSTMIGGAPDTARLDAGMQNLTGQYYTPQTDAGRYTQAVGQFVPNMLLGPEGWGAKAVAAKTLGAVVPGVAGQAAADTSTALGHPEIAPWARVGATIAGGGLAGLPFNPSGATRAIANATENLTPKQLALIQGLRESSEGLGMPVTLGEAGSHVAGDASRLAMVQQLTESSERGGAAMRPFYAARPQQARDALALALDKVGPAKANPSLIGTQAQTAAQSGLDRVRAGINAAASPAYTAAEHDAIAPSDYAALDANPSYQIALKAVRSDPELGPSIAHLPDNNAAVVNEAVKELDRSANAAQVTQLNPNGNNALAGARSQASQLAKRIASASSANFANARQTVADQSAAQLDPLAAGPLGKIASTDQTGRQIGALYPTRPLEGAPGETAAAIDAMGNDDLARALTRLHLGSSASESMQDLRNGPNPYAPATWAAQVAGNPIQRDTLLAGLGASAGPDTAQHFGDLLDTFSATGRRLPVSSRDQAMVEALQGAPTWNPNELGVSIGVAKEALGGSAGPLAFLGLKGAAAAKNAYSRTTANMRAEALAKALMSPADQTSNVITDARSAMSAAQARRARLLANALAASGQGADAQ